MKIAVAYCKGLRGPDDLDTMSEDFWIIIESARTTLIDVLTKVTFGAKRPHSITQTFAATELGRPAHMCNYMKRDLRIDPSFLTVETETPKPPRLKTRHLDQHS